MSAPKPVGPYTPIVRAGDWLIVSGQVGVEGGKLPDGVAAQTAQAVRNVAAQLATEGAALTDVAKTLCFLTDMPIAVQAAMWPASSVITTHSSSVAPVPSRSSASS